MSTKPRVSCRLSPNEEAALLRQQHEKRRKERLVQVREQERVFAQRVRDEVRSKQEAERRLLEEHLKTAVEASHDAELRELEEKYLSRMREMGQGHSNAQHILKEENRLQELRLLLTAEQRWRAQERHLAAMKELSANQLRKKEGKQSALQSRRHALEQEKRRTQELAAKPQSAPTLIMDLAVGKGHRVRLKEVEGYASTYYHIPNNTVQRAQTPELSRPSAHHMAQTVMEQDEKTVKRLAAVRQEHLEKARLRHKHAMARVKMGKDKEEMLKQLKTLEREDRTHRQKKLATMPANMFQPVHRRLEMVSEQQRDMEQAFENLFVKKHGAHPHHVFAHMGPEEEQTHSQLSEESTPPHPATGVESLAESPQSDEQPPQQTPPIWPKSPTPTPVKVPTATWLSSSGLSITDVTSSDEVMADDAKQVNTTSSSLSTRQPEFGLGMRHVGREPLNGEAHEKPQGEAEDHTPVWKEMPQLQLPSRGEGMRRLVDMIKSQHQAWNERMAARARQPLHSPPLPQSTPAVPHTERGTSSLDLSGQPESLSIYTLSSSGHETTPSHTSMERSTASPPQTREGGNQTNVRNTMAALPTTSEAYEKEVLYSSHPLHASTAHHTGVGAAGIDRHIWVRPQPSPMPDTLSISPYSTTLEVSHTEEASTNSAPLTESFPHGPLQTQEDPLLGQLQPPHSFHAYPYQASQPIATYTPISDHLVLHTSTVKYPSPYALHSHQWSYTHHYHATMPSYSKQEAAVQAVAEESNTEHGDPGPSGVQQPIVYSSLETVTSSLSKQSESTLGSGRNLESPEATLTGYTSTQQQSQQELLHQHSAPGVSDSMEPPHSPSTLQQPEVAPTQFVASSSPPSLYSYPVTAQFPGPSFNRAVTYTEPLSITTLETSQPLSAVDNTCSSASTSPSHTDGVVTQDPVLTATADQILSPTFPFTESRLDEEFGQASDHQASLDPLETLQPPLEKPSVRTPTPNGSTGSEVSLPVDKTTLLSHSTSGGTATSDRNAHSELPSNNNSIVPSGECASETSSIMSKGLEETETKPPTHSPPTLSLQEAFLRKKQDFIRKSQSRVRQLADSASQRQLEMPKLVGPRHTSPRHTPTTQRHQKYVSSTDQGNTSGPHAPLILSDDKKRAVTFSSPVSHLQSTGMFTPPDIHKAGTMKPPVLSSQKRERIKTQEMKERNLRFYNRLPEVCKKREEDARTKEYATNRERARQYQQKIRSRMSAQKQPRTLINLTKHKEA